jgi:enamine deaminase RidA (YjgF/YER057c/UK114 family)
VARVGAEQRLAELGIELPPVQPPVASFVLTKRHGDLLFVSGHGPIGMGVAGKVDADVSLDEAREAARLTGLLLLATLRDELGSLDRVRSIVKLLGMVNCSPGFTDIPAVINGCSDLFVEVFGEEIGRHTRSAVGMAQLPFGIPVEVEMIAAVDGPA